MFIILLLQSVFSQPCTSPINLIGSSYTTGVCTPPVSASQLITFPYGSLGTTTNTATFFSLTFWLRPPVPSIGGNTYGILRVSTDSSDTTPSTTNGIRLAVYISLDSTNKGFYLGYSESPSSPILYTDITQMATTFSGQWMFIYAGLNYDTGEMKLATWETAQTFWQYKAFSASKVSFNGALDTNTEIDVFYWGSQNSFCGDIMKLNWMPNYYESNNDNIFKLPYYLEGKSNNKIYLYRFDTIGQSTVTNLANSQTLTLQQAMTATYYEMSLSFPVVQLATSAWTTSTKSYTFGAYVMLVALPQSGADLILFQRYTSSSSNLFSIKLSKQSTGQLGILLTLQTTSLVLVSYTCTISAWYYISVQVAFPNSIQSQAKTLAYYTIIGPDGTVLSSYKFMTYTGTISTIYQSSDQVYIGDALNPYQGAMRIRLLRFEEGFQIFLNSQCQTDCIVGRDSETSSEQYCYICNTSSMLDSTFLCTQSSCSTNYYEITDMVSSNFCAYCDSSQSYYVNPSQICIQSACGNSYKEPPSEDCDDGGTVSGDGCDLNCKYEVGYNCSPATDYQLTTCVKLCGNGAYNIVTTPASLYYNEECDDGNTVANDGCTNCAVDKNIWECGAGFPSVCTKLCGNGLLNNVSAYGQTEVCDDGNNLSGDGCSATCQVESAWICSSVSLQLSVCVLICGNGVINAGEQCDDGNLIANDGCTNCIIDQGWDCSGTICTQYCGNGVVNVIPAKSINEQCDDGNSVQYDGCYNCLIETGWTCDSSNPTKCHLCGNSIKEYYETCDDGNTTNGDGCSSTCLIESGWTCNGNNPDICNNCGDGKKQQTEECDDGNYVSNDGCTNCTIDDYYECTGGSPTSQDTCIRTCPNGIISGSEQCDDANFINNDGCTNCLIDTGYICLGQPSVCNVDVCGNGYSNSVNEQCDDGNTTSGDGCSSTCQIEDGYQCPTKLECTTICGDGKRIGNEECDDANLIDGDGCSSVCKVELAYTCTGGSATTSDVCVMTCGDNVRDSNEQCDDGNTRNGDGCSSVCYIETGYGCSAVLMQDNVTRDECYNCVSNCAVCTDTTIDSCTLCYSGYYKNDEQCTTECDDGYYPDSISQTCQSCGTNCVKCYNSNACYRCQSPYILDDSINCATKCSDGYFVATHELKGSWCKKCPEYCTSCTSETICTTCDDYYSANGLCKYCDMGELCLSCNFDSNTCTKCILGYRPIEDNCILINDKCGDGLVSLNEKCDDGNTVNGDGCSRNCTIEDGANCRLINNQGPSECFDTLGWSFELQSFLLDPTLILLEFSNSIKYDNKLLTNISTIFSLSINGFTSSDYSYSFVNNSGSNQSIYIQFTFSKNVVSQKLTAQLNNLTVLSNYYDVSINPNETSASVDLYDKEFYTSDQIDFFNLLRNVAYGLQILNWILVIGAGFLDQKYRIWKTIEILQVICVLYYFNVRSYPLNAELMLEDLRYSNFYILPNYFEEHTDLYLESLKRFQMAGMTYQVLNNAGGRFLFYLAISVGVYLIAKLIYNKYVLFVFEVFIDKLEFSYFFKFYELFLLDLLICCFHNIKFNSMASNWDGTNTIISLILLLMIILIQITIFLISFFRDKFGTPEEIQIMFGTLTDCCKDEDKKRRLYMSQQDFIKKLCIAIALIYYDDPFLQLLLIIIPRGVITIINCLIIKTWFVRVKEVASEFLLYGIIVVTYFLAQGNFVGDLDTKIQYGQIWVYLLLAFEISHGGTNTYLVWRLLYQMESTLPEEIDPNAGVNKKIDLFRLKQAKFKGKTKKELEDEMERKRKLEEEKRKKKAQKEQEQKNANRDKWNVWNMKREANPEERKFVSINHKEIDDDIVPQVPKLKLDQRDELINFDELDELDQMFGQPPQQINTTNTIKQQSLGQTNSQFKQTSQQFGQTSNIFSQTNQQMSKTNTNLGQTQQFKMNQTQFSGLQVNKSQDVFQDQLSQANKTQQMNQTSQQGQTKSLFQFPQQEKKEEKKQDQSQDESAINDNPFDF